MTTASGLHLESPILISLVLQVEVAAIPPLLQVRLPASIEPSLFGNRRSPSMGSSNMIIHSCPVRSPEPTVQHARFRCALWTPHLPSVFLVFCESVLAAFPCVWVPVLHAWDVVCSSPLVDRWTPICVLLDVAICPPQLLQLHVAVCSPLCQLRFLNSGEPFVTTTSMWHH